MIMDNSDCGCPREIENCYGKVEEQGKALEAGAKRYASAITQAFASAVTGGKQFDDVLKSLALRISQMALQSAMRPLVGGIAGGLDKMLGGLFGGLFGTGGAVAAPSYFPAAAGGSLASDHAPGVGAAGGALARGAVAGDASARVSINISTPDVESFRRSEAYVTGQIARAVARGQRTL